MNTVGDYLTQLVQLLPRGKAWPRPPRPNLKAILEALANTLWRVDRRANGLIDEADPRSTTELLVEWEQSTGLPDPCVTEALNVQQRRNAVVARLQSTGGANAAYFVGVAANLGYDGVTVDEVSAHVWRMNIPQLSTETRFRAGQGVAGDRLVVTASQAIECFIERIKPAHSRVVYNYGAT